jgi:hypothetical protein
VIAQPVCEDWITILAPTPVYAVDDAVLTEPIWVAQAGDRYRVQRIEGGYALAVLSSDRPHVLPDAGCPEGYY